jgi:hypothetical protein
MRQARDGLRKKVTDIKVEINIRNGSIAKNNFGATLYALSWFSKR